MSKYNDVRTAVGDAITAYQPLVNVYHYVPKSLTPPAAIVQPVANRTIEYLQAQSSVLAKWNFNVLLVIGQVDEQAAQDMAGELISPGSDLIQSLTSIKFTSGYSQVTEAAISEMAFGNGLYTYARLVVSITA